MNEDLFVTCKAHGIGTIYLNHPTVSKAIHANENGTGDYLGVIYAISDLLDSADIVVDDWDIDEIHDGDSEYSIGLFDYEGTPIKTYTMVEETA
jgi:hypothetical protein